MCPFGPLTSEKLASGLRQSKQNGCKDGGSQGQVCFHELTLVSPVLFTVGGNCLSSPKCLQLKSSLDR